MLELSPATFPFIFPDHLNAFMWALIVLAAALGLALFGAAMAVLETVLETIEARSGRPESST